VARERASRRARRPREHREREILAAARAVFSERGFARASVAEIARRADVAEGTVYQCFASKHELLVQVLRGFYEPLIAEVETGVRQIRGAGNRLRYLIARHLQTFTADRGLCRLVIRELRAAPGLHGQAVRELNRRYTAPALEAIEAGVRDGELRRDLVPALIRDLIYGGIEHAVWGHVAGGAPIDAAALAEQLADAVLAGIEARPRPAERAADRLERLLERLEERVAS